MSRSSTNSNHEAFRDSETQAPNNIASSLSSSNNLSLVSWIPPRGFKFEPTDTDICFYLDLFFRGNLPLNIPIHRVNIYESTPEQLLNEYMKGNEKEWFFITERTRRSEGGKNLIRTDKSGGTWKGTQGAKEIEDENGVVVGNKSALEYKSTENVKGDWLMLEYSSDSYGQNVKVDYALCKIYMTPKGANKRIAEEAEDKKKKKKIVQEVVKALQEELDQSLDDVALQPPQLEPPQPQQQPPSDAYQVPLDSHQQKPVIPNDGVDLAHYFYWHELVPQPQEVLDQPLDDVSLQPPQLESSQPQQQPPSDAYQGPQDSYQHQPMIPYNGVATYLNEFAPHLQEKVDQPLDVPCPPQQLESSQPQHHLCNYDAYQVPLDDIGSVYWSEYEEFMKGSGFLANEFDEMINLQPPPVIPDNNAANADYMGDLYPQLHEEYNNGYLEDIVRQGMRICHT